MLITLEIQQNAVDRWYIELDTSWAGARKTNAFNALDALQRAFGFYLDVLPDDKLALQGIPDKEIARAAMLECVGRIRRGKVPVVEFAYSTPVDNLAKARAAKAAKRALSGLKENPA